MPQSWARGWFFNLLKIQRRDDLIQILDFSRLRPKSSRRWRCCRAWGRWWAQSRSSQSTSSSPQWSTPEPGPRGKLKKMTFEMCMSLEKSFSCSRISFTSGAVLQKVLPVAFSLAALRRHVALGGATALVPDIRHLNHHWNHRRHHRHRHHDHDHHHHHDQQHIDWVCSSVERDDWSMWDQPETHCSHIPLIIIIIRTIIIIIINIITITIIVVIGIIITSSLIAIFR